MNEFAVPLKENGIINTIGKYIDLQIRGGRGFCQCPFCKNTGKNFIVAEKEDKYKCFACGDSGDKVEFLSKYKHITKSDAMQELGIKESRNEATEQRKQNILSINNEAGKYYNSLLKGNSSASKYLFDRALTKSVVNSFGLGFSGTQKYGLTEYLKRKGYDTADMIESGLVGKYKNGRLYDKFVNRIMFPIFDTNNDLVGFGGRVLDDSKPKYLNSPASIVFDKSHVLYGYNKAIKSNADSFIICEGYMDVIAMHKNGYTNAVASLGTAFNQIGRASCRERV